MALPEETARVARAASPTRTRIASVRDTLEEIAGNEQFTAFCAQRGRPVHALWRLAMVLALPCVEGLTDRHAADAVRGHRDWTYALGVSVEDPGCDASVRSAYRSRLVAGGAELQR